MKDLVKRYLDHDLSRAGLLKGLSALGLTASAAGTIADALAPTSVAAAEAAGATRTVTDIGGMLFVQQLKAAGVKFYFFNPSTGDAPIFDAFASERDIQLIKGIQEGVVVGMADGYARLSGKPGVASIANVGLPNGMTQLVNTYKDRIPLLLVIAAFGQDQLGRDGPQDYEHQELMMQPITKWWWLNEGAGNIPEVTRRALKFATTAPSGPVFLSIPDNELRTPATASIMDQSRFLVPGLIRADQSDIQKVAQMLIESKNPLLTVGDEITLSNGQVEVLELAELLGLPVAGGGEFGVWSKPFPTAHPLYTGPIIRNPLFPQNADLRLNIGNQYGEVRTPGAVLISIRRDPTSLARNTPVDLGLVADPKLAAADLVAAIKSQATAARLQQIAQDRLARARAFTAGQAQVRQTILKGVSGTDNGPIPLERLALELESEPRARHDLRQRPRHRQEHGSVHVIRRQGQDVRRDRPQHSRLGDVGRLRRQARASQHAGGRNPRRRGVPLRRSATVVEPSPLQRADHEHRLQ